MKERKNIEHLFQEKFENYQVNPPDEIWYNLEEELKKKKEKKRIIPFWWKLSGIAALLLVGYSIYTTVSGTADTLKENQNPISHKEIIDTENKSNKSTDSNEENKNDIEAVATSTNSETETKNKFISKKQGTVVKSDDDSQKNNISNHSDKLIEEKKINYDQNKVLVEKNSEKSKYKKEENYSTKSKNNNSTLSIDLKEKTYNNDDQNKVLVEKNSEKSIPKKEENYNSNSINDQKSNTNNIQKIINQKLIQKENQVTLTKENNTQDDKIAMKNHSDIVTTKGEIVKKTDSTAIANVEPNAMEELLKEKENKSTQKQKVNRWQVAPNLAPVYFGSIKNGSPLDESLNDNAKDFKTSTSYGLSVNYAVTKKIKVRTGVNVFSINYDTQGIVFYQDSNAKMMKNVNPTSSGSLIQIEPLTYVNTEFNKVISERFDGVLNQKMGYIEMPVEMSYKLLDKKFGIEILGGFSTLFLNENEIYLRSDGLNTKIGTATNLNNVHFSTNIGLGINYRLLKKLDARIEPSFKYQMNTFSFNSTEFRPYIFGIYSGVSYRF